MTLRPQLVFWVAAGLVLGGLLVMVSGILWPFVLGAGIAYLLDPLADRLERNGLSRFWATMIIGVLFAVTMLLILVGLLPVVIDQLIKLAGRLPEDIQALREILTAFAEKHFSGWLAETDTGFEQALTELLQEARGSIGSLLKSVLSGGLALVNFLAFIVVAPVVAFYLLLDWNRILRLIDGWLPRQHAETIRGLAGEIDEVISGFVRGQVTVLLLLSVIYVVGLKLIGLKFALLVGLSAGLVSFVPYVGPVVGFVVGGIVSVGQFWPDWVPIAAVLGVFVAGQVVEGNFLSPMIVGDRVRLHPVWLIFSLFVFAYLFGFLGMLIAVPVAAAIGVLVRFALTRYLASQFYRGDEPEGPAIE